MKKNKIFDTSFKNFKDNLSYTLLCSSFMSLIVIVLYALAASILGTSDLFDSSLGMLIFLLMAAILFGILSPFIYSYFTCNLVLQSDKKDQVRLRSFFKTAILGTRRPAKGQLDNFNNILTTFLIYIVLMFGLNLIVVPIIFQNDEEFARIFNEMIESNNFMLSEKDAQYVLHVLEIPNLIIYFICSYFSFLYFLNNMTKNTFRYLMAPLFFELPNRAKRSLFKTVLKQHKKEFNKDYYRVGSIPLVVYLVVFPISYFALYFTRIPGLSISIINLTAFSITLILILPFLPLVYNFYICIWPKREGYFLGFVITNAKKELDYLKSHPVEMSEEEKNRLKIAERNIEKLHERFSAKTGQNEEVSNVEEKETKEETLNEVKDNENKVEENIDIKVEEEKPKNIDSNEENKDSK